MHCNIQAAAMADIEMILRHHYIGAMMSLWHHHIGSIPSFVFIVAVRGIFFMCKRMRRGGNGGYERIN